MSPFHGKRYSELHLLETFPNASNADITSFHALTGGNPRVQSYALQAANGKLETLFEAMLPNGKSLPDVIEASFTLALLKLGERDILDGLVASLASSHTRDARSRGGDGRDDRGDRTRLCPRSGSRAKAGGRHRHNFR